MPEQKGEGCEESGKKFMGKMENKKIQVVGREIEQERKCMKSTN